MSNIVLLTSALYTNYGIYDPKERIQQTLETAQSAKKYIPDAVVVLVDNSKVDVLNEDSDEFNELLDTVDYYLDNCEDPDIELFHRTCDNYDIGKNAMEALGMTKALRHMLADEDMQKELKDCHRIFKLSGRYRVTDQFDIEKFDNENTKDKYVFKQSQPSWINPEDTGVNTLLQTRLWSFTPSLLEDTSEMYKNIIETMLKLFNEQKYIDNEHAMSKFIPKDKLVELETVGLEGNIAPNGMMVID